LVQRPARFAAGIGLILGAVGDADAGHTIAGHDQVYDQAPQVLSRHGEAERQTAFLCVDHRIEPASSGKTPPAIADHRGIDVGLHFPHLGERVHSAA
jgi:hypothetical protein